MTPADFAAGLRRHKGELEDVVGAPVHGYRAPCFSMTRDKLELLPELGFAYDSSWIRFDAHPLYGSMDLSDWAEPVPGVRRAPSGFLEFEVPTLKTRLGTTPVGGGAYFRVYPWALTRRLVRRFLGSAQVYVFYIHPFECSAVRSVVLPEGTSRATRLRFQLGRGRTLPRLHRLIALLRAEGFHFSTFSQAARELGA